MQLTIPRYLILDLTRRCNMRCPNCIYLLYDKDYFSNEEMSLQCAQNIISYYRKKGVVELFLTAEGEISLYRNFNEIVEFSRNAGYQRVHLNSNGLLLERYQEQILKNVDSIYISVDGYDRESYKKHRGIDTYDKVVRNLRNLVELRNNGSYNTLITLACVIYEEKLDTIAIMIELAEDIGVDRIEFFNFHAVGTPQDCTALTETTQDITSHYDKVLSRQDYSLEIILPAPLYPGNNGPFYCDNLFNTTVLGARGDFAPCCRIPPDAKYGNFNENRKSYEQNEILRFKELFATAKSKKDLASPCQSCQALSSKTYVFQTKWRVRSLVGNHLFAYQDVFPAKDTESTKNIPYTYEEITDIPEQKNTETTPNNTVKRIWWLPFFARRIIGRYFGPRLGRLQQYPATKLQIPKNYLQTPIPQVEKLPKISIVTPSFNQGEFIERTILSVLQQNYPNIEYIIQDGASTDRTSQILNKYHDKINVTSAPDDGQTQAINNGFAKSSGTIMAWLNSDDILFPGTISYVAQYFLDHPEVDVIYGHRILMDENDDEIGRWILPQHDAEVLKWVDMIPQETLFWRDSIWKKIGGTLDESFDFAMDWDLLLRFQDAGANFKRLPRFLGGFRVHSQQKTIQQMSTQGTQEISRLQKRQLGRSVSREEIARKTKKYIAKHLILEYLHRCKLL